LSCGKACAELNPFDSRHGKYYAGNLIFYPVEHRLPDPHGQTAHHAFDHPADRVSFPSRGLDRPPHSLTDFLIHDGKPLACDRGGKSTVILYAGDSGDAGIYGMAGLIYELRGETEPKHPTQLYEAFSYLLLGLVMVWIYKYKLDKVHRGFFFGLFLLGCFGSRFLIEFIKEPQVEFEQTMALDMGQILSIPFILAGIGLLIYAARTKKPAAVVHPQPVKKEPTHYARSLK